MLTKEDSGRRVRHRVHDMQGELVAVHNETVGDVRWDFGARWNWQQLGKDFEFVNQEVPNERENLHQLSASANG